MDKPLDLSQNTKIMKKVFYLIFIAGLISCSTERDVYNIITYNIRYDNPNDGENKWSNRKAKVQVNNYVILSDSKDCKYPPDHLPAIIEVEF